MEICDISDFVKIIKVLETGGIVMHPTETCYGLAVDIFNVEALKRLYAVKKMAQDKPLSILCADLKMAKEYGGFSPKALEMAEKYWPGALSILVPRTEKLPDFLNPEQEFVSIRVSSDDFCAKMVREFGRPVTTTSANVSGEPQFYEVDLSQFGKGKIDLVVDGGRLLEKKPSTIVKVNGKEIEVLRQGEIDLFK